MIGVTDNDNTDVATARPSNSQLYPWYDSVWLSTYEEAKSILLRVKPQALAGFVETFRPLRTRTDFKIKLLDQPFDDATLAEIRRVAASMHPTDLELHEAWAFGRFIVHDHAYFTELQQRIAPLVSELAGEAVEPMYNFLSLYTSKGVCAVHMDAPKAKWTLDLCIDQSAPWPIYFSEVQPWPDALAEEWKNQDWENKIRKSRSLEFTPYTLEPGQAVLFSGSSQWHYRDPMPEAPGKQFCNLLFFHFIPKGTSELVRPENWARLFSVPELKDISHGRST